MKNNINKKIGATLLTAAIMTGSFVMPVVKADLKENEAKPVISYRAHVQDIGWQDYTNGIAGTEGKSLRMEAINVKLENCKDVSLSMEAHVQDIGWIKDLTEKDLIGTTNQSLRMEAIVIKANGLAEQGYKLQYRVHVQDIGWTSWIDEGEVAGTTGRSLRVEAIEIKTVEDLTYIKQNRSFELSKCDAALSTLKGTILTEKQYDNISKKIAEAIENINKATSKEDINTIYEKAMSDIKGTYNKIEELLQKVAEEKAKAEAKAQVEIDAYNDVLSNIEGLSEDDKEIIETILANAEEDIANARTATEVEEAMAKLEILMSNYSDVQLAQAKKVAVDTLTPYLESANEGVKTVIEEAIEEINSEKIATVNGVKNKLDETLNQVDPLLVAQESSLDKLSVYEEVLNESKMSASRKKIVKDAIDNAKEQIENATTKDDVDTIISNFEDFIKANYSSIQEGVEEKLIQVAADKAIEELSKYLKYVDDNNTVKEMAEKCIERIEYLSGKPGTTPQDIAKELGDKEEENTMIYNLEKAIEAIEADIKEQEAKYTEAYTAAMKELENCEEILPELDLTKKQLADITTVINSTKAKISNATRSGEVVKAMTVFKEYMDKYYPEVAKNISDFELEQTRAEMLETLNEYVNKTETAITNVKNAKDMDALNVAYAPAKTVIDTYELDNAKTKAKEQLETYLGQDDEADVKIVAAQNLIDVATKIEDIEKIVNDTIENIRKLIDEEILNEQGLLKQKREQAEATIRTKYLEKAEDLNDSNLEKYLNSCIDAINDETDRNEIDRILAEIPDYIKENAPLYNAKLDAIAKLEAYYYDDAYPYMSDTANMPYIREQVDYVISKIKTATTEKKVAELLGAEGANGEYQGNEDLVDAVKKVTDQIDTLEEYKEEKAADLDNITGKTQTSSTAIDTVPDKVAEFKKRIDSVTIKEGKAKVDAIVAEANSKLPAYIDATTAVEIRQQLTEAQNAQKKKLDDAVTALGILADVYTEENAKLITDKVAEVKGAIDAMKSVDEVNGTANGQGQKLVEDAIAYIGTIEKK